MFLQACHKRYDQIKVLSGKIKSLGRLELAGRRVLEFKVPLQGADYRMAYIADGEYLLVLYASDEIRKAAFAKNMKGLRF